MTKLNWVNFGGGGDPIRNSLGIKSRRSFTILKEALAGHRDKPHKTSRTTCKRNQDYISVAVLLYVCTLFTMLRSMVLKSNWCNIVYFVLPMLRVSFRRLRCNPSQNLNRTTTHVAYCCCPETERPEPCAAIAGARRRLKREKDDDDASTRFIAPGRKRWKKSKSNIVCSHSYRKIWYNWLYVQINDFCNVYSHLLINNKLNNGQYTARITFCVQLAFNLKFLFALEFL